LGNIHLDVGALTKQDLEQARVHIFANNFVNTIYPVHSTAIITSIDYYECPNSIKESYYNNKVSSGEAAYVKNRQS